MNSITYSDIWRPSERVSARLYDISLILGGSLLIALLAQIRFLVPFSPVPVTGQTFGVLLVGTLLGSRKGVLSLSAYLTEGSLGLPFFAGGAAGFAHLLGPTGGYLLGFIVAAFICGYLAEKGWDRNVISTFAMMVLGTAAIFALGLAWLKYYIGAEMVLKIGLYPFVIGAFIKIGVAGAVLPIGWRLTGKVKRR